MTTTPRQPTIYALDGIRAFACLLVVFGHSGYQGFMPILPGIATFGVMLFFTLSGFLMAYHYHPTSFSIRYWVSFLSHRFIRVYPAFAFATLGYLLLRPHLPDVFPLGNDLPALAELTKGWLLQDKRGIFWTVPVEIDFYFIYPFLAAFIAVLTRQKRVLSVLLILVAIIVLLKLFVFQHLLTLTYGVTFLSGVIAAVFLRQLNEVSFGKPHLWTVTAVATFFGLLLLIAHFIRIIPSSFQMWGNALYLAPLIGLFIVSIARAHSALGFLFSNRVMRWIGKISYSIYLMHFFVITAVRVYVPLNYRSLLLVLIATALVSIVFYYVVERPFTKLAKWIGRNIRENWPAKLQAS